MYLSTRSGSWVTKRVGYRGIPNDYIFARHYIFDLLKYLPGRLVNFVAETALNMRFNHKLYGLQPKHRYLGQHVMVNDDLPNRIVSGEVVMKPNIRRITKTGVEFEDGSFEDDINIIIYATGYVFDFPFIEHKALAVKKNEVSLFKYVFPPAVQPPTIAIVGCVQPFGAVMPISEMQGRLAVKVFKVLGSLSLSLSVYASLCLDACLSLFSEFISSVSLQNYYRICFFIVIIVKLHRNDNKCDKKLINSYICLVFIIVFIQYS